MTDLEFVRAIYLNSNPPVDITKTKEKINYRNHKIAEKKWNEIRDKYSCGNSEKELQAAIWMIISGPMIVHEDGSETNGTPF